MSRDVGSINRVLLVGNVGRNPETRVVAQTQNRIAHFSLATKERSFNPNTKETKDYTEWHRITVWGRQAEFVEKYVVQGKLLLVEGKLRTKKWQDRTGVQRTTTEVEAINVVLLGRKEPGAPPAMEEPAPDVAPSDFPAGEEDFGSGGGGGPDDDIPF